MKLPSGPNGASMRPNSQTQQSCRVELPDELILVHEFNDHYSLQARKSMTVEELNARITDFLATKGERLTKEEWLEKYPEATEVREVRGSIDLS
ncbi:hypothetical protein ARAM_006030 [Aspergillus rambellii]|uniref:Tse2 ADP-ribosyltransferase toxin domain-containing protein n=1 Tax=Aspergillus rambellii TaxID=308745 RepID=A0A0F8WR15_9EURO|nr:hypothetical protein ARAM_006030 [Aspergillus rambellii]